MEGRDLRNVIELLLKSHKIFKSRATALRMVLEEICGNQASRSGAQLRAQIEARFPEILAKTDEAVNAQAQQIETRLKSEDNFLDALRVYASQQFWSGRGSDASPPNQGTIQ
jgi:hypothetical protein